MADDGGVTGRKRIVSIAAGVAAALLTIGLGVLFVVIGLTRADKVASVIGALSTLIGLALSVYGLILARRGSASPTVPSASQTVTKTLVGSNVVQVYGVQGNLRIGQGSISTADPTALLRPSPGPVTQSVDGSYVSGTAYQIGDVGGNADLDP